MPGRMVNEALRQMDAFTTPGTLLRTAREARGMSSREAADQLHLMPGYVTILEQDEYDSLRSPAFARGYVKAYSRLLDLDESELLQLFDQLRDENQGSSKKRIETKPLQLQHTGLGVVIGLCVLLLLAAALWWWRADGANSRSQQVSVVTEMKAVEPVQPPLSGESE